jgi:hypothetical protein
MRYWGYLVVKLTVWLAVLAVLDRWIAQSFPPLKAFAEGGPNPVMHDFMYMCSMLLFTLFAVGTAWLIAWDQRGRCRTCVRRLCMPIQTGSWTHVLLGAPRTEYICPYGHGTLKVAELRITGRQGPEWQAHDDMWKELFSLEETRGR